MQGRISIVLEKYLQRCDLCASMPVCTDRLLTRCCCSVMRASSSSMRCCLMARYFFCSTAYSPCASNDLICLSQAPLTCTCLPAHLHQVIHNYEHVGLAVTLYMAAEVQPWGVQHTGQRKGMECK